MKSGLFLSVGALLLAANVAQADVTIFKMFDGATAYCNANTNTTGGAKVVRVELVSEKASQSNQDATLKVSLVKCDKGQWIADQAPTVESYIAPNGQKVDVTFSDYTLYLVNNKGQVVLQTTLDQFNSGVAQQDYSMAVTKEKETPQDLELVISAKKTVKAQNGYEFFETSTFGGFRVRLN